MEMKNLGLSHSFPPLSQGREKGKDSGKTGDGEIVNERNRIEGS